MKTFESPIAPVSVLLPARIENLPRFIAPVLAVARALSIGEDRCNDLELALEESLVNIVNYAYPEKDGSVQVACRTEKDRLVVCLEDEGVAFDVTGAGAADLSPDVSARRIGGLGIHLVRSLMDDVRYRREGNRNVLELVFFFQPGEVTQ